MRLPISRPERNAPRSAIKGIDESAALIRRGLDRGITYVDSAPSYCHSESETAVGRAIKGLPRDRLTIVTKFPQWGSGACGKCLRTQLELSLRRLDTDYLDFYLFWNLSLEGYTQHTTAKDGPMEAARKAREEGLIRHIGLSCHDKPENCTKLIETGEFESLLVQYNLLDRQYAPCLRLAHERGMGTAVMGPVSGGRLAAPSAVITSAAAVSSTAEAALRFVWANGDIDVTLSGMSDVKQVDENLATADRAEPLSADEIARIDAVFEKNKRLLDLPCTGCGYCTPCPKGVATPEIFRLYQWHEAFGLKGPAREGYAGMGKGWQEKQKDATACDECGECEDKCPQKIAIREKLKAAHKVLAAKG